MKTRCGFISNSSSSSFIVRPLCDAQKNKILEKNRSLGKDGWQVLTFVDSDEMVFTTYMNNFPYDADYPDEDDWVKFFDTIKLPYHNQ